jgi:hypothetical protein
MASNRQYRRFSLDIEIDAPQLQHSRIRHPTADSRTDCGAVVLQLCCTVASRGARTREG